MYRYALLGLLQGLTEFLPVSSSGHLVLAQRLLGLDPPGVALEAVLHLATLAAVVVYFHRSLGQLARGLISPAGGAERRYIGSLILGTFPIAVVGYLFRESIEGAFASPGTVGWMLLVTAAALGLAGWGARRARREELRLGDALLVGLAQAVALLPGASRSGLTISAGILLGVSPKQATRFSFLLALPALLGAGLLTLLEAPPTLAPGEAVGLASAGLVALISGLVAIHLLLRLLRRLPWFSLYCLVLGLIVLTTA